MLINIWKSAGLRPPRARRAIATALAISYPLFAHAGILVKSAGLTLASVCILVTTLLFTPLVERRRWAFFALPVAAAACALLWKLDGAALVLFLPPILLNAFLAWLFGFTLRPGSVPLIERVVRLLQPPGQPAEPAVIAYVRRLTLIWALLFVALATTNLVLAALVVPGGLLDLAELPVPFVIGREAWSLFANVLSYLIIAAFFLVEFGYRMRRFPGRPYRNMAEFLQRMASIAPALAATFATTASERAPMAPGELITTRLVPRDHPAFSGHFPGRPVLPGVVLLEWALEAAVALYANPPDILAVPRVKFIAPLGPGDLVTLRLRRSGEMLEFDAHRGSDRVAEGVFRLGARV